MPSRRLSGRIYELCAKAIKTPEGPELEMTIKGLQTAIREHTARIRHRLVPPGPERRVAWEPDLTKETHSALLWDLFRETKDEQCTPQGEPPVTGPGELEQRNSGPS